MNEIRDFFALHGLYRSRDRWLGGVASGLGKRLGLSPNAARLLFVLTLIVVPGCQLLVYPVLWVLMPREGEVPVATGPATYA